MSAHFRRGGLSPTRVLARALTHAPAECCLDVDSRASVLLEGEQKFTLPCVGSEQHAPLVPPQNSSFSPLCLVPPSPETATRGFPPGEGVASEQHAVDPRLEVLKPPDPNEEPLEEPRGVCLGGTEPACVAENADVGTTIERTGVGAHEPGGVPLGAIAAPAYTEGAAGIELIGVAEKAAAAEPEALEPWAKSGRPRGPETPPPIEGE